MNKLIKMLKHILAFFYCFIQRHQLSINQSTAKLLAVYILFVYPIFNTTTFFKDWVSRFFYSTREKSMPQ